MFLGYQAEPPGGTSSFGNENSALNVFEQDIPTQYLSKPINWITANSVKVTLYKVAGRASHPGGGGRLSNTFRSLYSRKKQSLVRKLMPPF